MTTYPGLPYVEILWIKRLMFDVGLNNANEPIELLEDNNDCIRLIMNLECNSQRTKHIDIKYFLSLKNL